MFTNSVLAVSVIVPYIIMFIFIVSKIFIILIIEIPDCSINGRYDRVIVQ